MFYERFVALCRSRGVSPSRAAEDAGLSKSAVTKWKNSKHPTPSSKVLEALSKYFGVTVTELLGEEEQLAASEDAIKFALFGGSGDITDDMYQEVLDFAAFIKAREELARDKE